VTMLSEYIAYRLGRSVERNQRCRRLRSTPTGKEAAMNRVVAAVMLGLVILAIIIGSSP
jgi:hypothetical protein